MFKGSFLIFRRWILKSVGDIFEEKSYNFLCFKGIFLKKTCLYKRRLSQLRQEEDANGGFTNY